MLLMLANTYVEDVKSTQSVISANIAEPVLLPDKGIWHPIADQVSSPPIFTLSRPLCPLSFFVWVCIQTLADASACCVLG